LKEEIKNEKLEDLIDFSESGAVEPKRDCPHCKPDNIIPLKTLIERGVKVEDPCKVCGALGEMWLCLKCGDVLCSRYVKGHMKEHN
jgi:uncharacterized UBP type Zn finger protein